MKSNVRKLCNSTKEFYNHIGYGRQGPKNAISQLITSTVWIYCQTVWPTEIPKKKNPENKHINKWIRSQCQCADTLHVLHNRNALIDTFFQFICSPPCQYHTFVQSPAFRSMAFYRCNYIQQNNSTYANPSSQVIVALDDFCIDFFSIAPQKYTPAAYGID